MYYKYWITNTGLQIQDYWINGILDYWITGLLDYYITNANNNTKYYDINS